ncbi:MCE family protein [Actinocatenispora sera]|uniref:ABC transporter substrate-binding protein n=1 Tax=Actinocatenispora sera TaxID=390989 RepID=A0A810L1H4_9ACTN|nr:MCE family protein [Actinocatenispora sera]BCJ29263.1 ABC transporter substrate-binding protein [Actinocatenispora sera]
MDPRQPDGDLVGETRVTVWPAAKPWGSGGRAFLGLCFILLVAALLAVSVGAYRQVFTPAVTVTVVTDHTGLQLDRHADVKLRGVVVGQVRDIAADGRTARLTVALDPGSVPRIPANVSASMLPKTLFGQKYVSLTPPAHPAGTPIAAGAVVHQDRSASAVELERVLDRALPLLKAVPPEKVSATLTALAAALRGRGDQLGDTLVTLDRYLRTVNANMPAIRADVRKLAGVLDTYTGALPDLMAVLANLTVTASTVSEQRAALAEFWSETTGLADTATPFLQRHEGRLIQLGQVSRPLLDVLAEYSPEYPCLTAAAVKLQSNIEGAFDTGRLHITLEITRDSGKYLPGDEPVSGADIGPKCWGLPDHPPVPAPEAPIDDGYDRGAQHGGVVSGLPQIPIVQGKDVPPDSFGQGGGTGSVEMGYAGTAEERAVVNPLVAAATARNVTDLGDITDLLWGPLLRGATVDAR